jgi:hypothetical protein
MRLVAFLSVFLTIALAYISHLDTSVQLIGVMVSSLFGAVMAIFVIRTPKFELTSIFSILILAAVLRLISLFAIPILEDDHFRYLWDGYLFATNGTPYGAAPANYFADEHIPETFRFILNFINYPDIPTIYGPVLQLLFLLGYTIAPGQVIALQALNACSDFFIILILARLGAKPKWLLLYAISPLVLKESVMTAHPDGLVALFALIGLVWVRRPLLMGSFLGFAIASKISAIILLPFLIKRGGLKAIFGAICALILCYLPFVVLPGSDMTALLNFANNWRFNPILFWCVEQFFEPRISRIIAAVFILTMLMFIYWRDSLTVGKNVPAVDHAFGTLLVLSPVFNSWYLLWLLPFSVLRPSRTAWAATFVIPLSYLNGSNGAQLGGHQFDLPTYITMAEICVLGLIAMMDVFYPLALPVDPIQKITPDPNTYRTIYKFKPYGK